MNDVISMERTVALMAKLMMAVDRGELPEPRHLIEGEDVCNRTPFNRRETLVARQAVRRVTTSVIAIQALEPGRNAARYISGEQLQRWRELIRAPRAWKLPPAGSQVEVVVKSERGFLHHEGIVLVRSVRRIDIRTATAGDWYVPHESPVPVQASGAVGYSWRPL